MNIVEISFDGEAEIALFNEKENKIEGTVKITCKMLVLISVLFDTDADSKSN